MPSYCNECGKVFSGEERLCSECGNTLQEQGDRDSAHMCLLDSRYQIVTTLKAGGMGCVYKALDRRLDCTVALKKMIPSSHTEMPYALERFREEARILSNLLHPGLPRVFDFFSAPDCESGQEAFFLVMTFIEGRDLESIFFDRKGAPFMPDEVLPWMEQILSILDYLHSQSPPIIYRDLNPRNVMIADSRLYLIDFGIAKVFHPQKKATVIGTPGYAAPEQYRGDAEPRSDIYSLGVLIHYLLTGRNPEESTDALFVFKRPASLNAAVSSRFDNIIMSMVDVIPDRRPPSAAVLLKMIEELKKADAPAASPPLQNPSAGGDTPPASRSASLFEAVEKLDCRETARFIEDGADVNARRNNGWTTLHSAVYHGSLEITLMLLASGARVDARRSDGWTPLHLAAYHGHTSIAEVLLDRGAEVNTKKDDGGTPLHMAIQGGHREMAELLITRGAPVNEANEEGRTPLHIAAYYGREALIELLMDKGASPGLRDSTGATPLRLARTYSHDGAARLLRRYANPWWPSALKVFHIFK